MKKLGFENLNKIFEEALGYWHSEPEDDMSFDTDCNKTALTLIYKNYLLWHEEDKARRDDVEASFIAQVKRNIDKLNQARNDLIEKLDEEILIYIQKNGKHTISDDYNSETAGSIVDRLSIMSLKSYHMLEDTQRIDITEEHKKKSQTKYQTLCTQKEDLYNALEKLIQSYLNGEKVIKLYKQFKMYNDPSLNPEVYNRK